MWQFLIIVTTIFLFECGNPTSSKPDSRLFNAWIYVGYSNLIKEYNVVDEYYYNDDQIMKMDYFTKDTMTTYTRGTFHPAVGITYFDSTKVTTYSISVDDNSIQGSDINTVNYEIKSEGDNLGLILSRTYEGLVNVGGVPTPATIYSENYLVKIDKDSLLADWPPVEGGS